LDASMCVSCAGAILISGTLVAKAFICIWENLYTRRNNWAQLSWNTDAAKYHRPNGDLCNCKLPLEPGRERSSKVQYILVTQKMGANLLPPPNYCLQISQNSVIQSTHCKCLLCTSTYCKLVQICNQEMFCHIQGIDLRNPAITV
jgi:hypothetical protein